MRVRGAVAALAIGIGLAAACRREGPPPAPVIQFSTVPESTEGGPDLTAAISGRVTGAQPGHRIVLFAKSGVWWVQPLRDEPFTALAADGTWKSTTHFGFEYAALLVDQTYKPPATLDELPSPGGGIVAVASTKGATLSSRPRKILQFSGYEWEVRVSASERGGTVNHNDPENAWVDEHGYMHLRIGRGPNGWTAAEVTLNRSLGYGTYMFVVSDVSHFEPATALSLYTWDPSGADPNHRELDIEISRWGDPANKSAQFVVQPYYVAANVARFAAPAGVTTYSFRWEPGKVLFRSLLGAEPAASARPVSEHLFTAGVPAAGAETVRMSMYAFVHTEHPLQNGAEVVVQKFVYLP